MKVLVEFVKLMALSAALGAALVAFATPVVLAIWFAAGFLDSREKTGRDESWRTLGPGVVRPVECSRPCRCTGQGTGHGTGTVKGSG